VSVCQQLAESTEQLRRAIESGDLTSAEQLLEQREAGLEALRRELAGSPPAPATLDQLRQILDQAAAAARSLTARRETARVLLGDLDRERRLLAGWTPHRPQSTVRMSFTG